MAKKIMLKDIQIGMKANVEQLSDIVDKYIILLYENADDTEGTIVFCDSIQTPEYERWFFQNKPITPIYHSALEIEENVVYDE